MARNIDVGVGTSNDASAFVAGCSAAAQAFSAISDYSPSLTLVFASGTYDPDAVAQGVESVVGVCPMIGTSSTGEICSEPVERSVVVTILASPHIIAEVNVGENVTRSWTTAAQNALPKRVGASHFAERSKLGRPLYFSHPAAGLAPIMLLVFAPGFTGSKSTRSYEIHDF
ncbi:MAG TPA: FIST N-terminal domain-containing protein, partial [Thermoleophilia bacterium]|nr:FIST N-terminal domain-containing protein [Thermoleophilia bacterium]